MAYKHLLHVKSNKQNADENGPKLPLPSQIEYGEIAINYLKDNEKISIKNSNNEIVTFPTDNQINTKMEIVAGGVNKLSTECGFNDSMEYEPKNELIQSCNSLSEAMEIVAAKANDTSTFATKEEVKDSIDLATYLKSHNTVETLTNVPIDKYLVIANINTTTASLTLADTLKEMQEIHIIVHNTNPSEMLTITLPSIGGFINLTETTMPVAADKYCEINIISDGTNMYIRAI